MTFQRCLVVFSGLLICVNCADEPVPEYRSASGSLALSADDKLAFVADQDNGALEVVDLGSRELLATVKVGALPQHVAVGKKGEVYVSNRGSRTVSVVKKSELGWQVVGEAKVGAEPTGLAVSPDGRMLAVANTIGASVSLVDTASLATVGEVQVGGAPRAVSFRPGKQEVYVTDYYGGLKAVDLEDLTVAREISLRLTPESRMGMEHKGDMGMPERPPMMHDTRSPGHVTSIALSPDGARAYLVHAQCKDDMIATSDGPEGPAPIMEGPSPQGGDSYGGGPDGSPPVVATAVTTVDVEENAPAPEVDDEETHDFPPPMLLAGPGRAPISMPSAAVADPSGKWLFVANLASNNVAVLSTVREQDFAFESPEEGLVAVIKVRAGPTGLAVTSDGAVAVVHNSFDHSLSILERVSDAAGERLAETHTISVGKSPLTEEQQRGRELFFSAVNPRMTNPATGIACASCHGDGGRIDGRTWNFSEGQRNTPTLAFHEINKTAPFHWDGKLPDIASFEKVIVERMGGTGLSDREFADLSAYLEVIPEVDNPHRLAQLSPEQALGKQLFEDATRANCTSCHSGPAYTDNKLRETATPFGLDNRIATPPLRGVFATAPYRHDGSAGTLRDLFTTPGSIPEMDLRGKLSGAEIDALVAYVETF